MAVAAAPIDNVFRALSNPTRRAVLEHLGARPQSVSELAAPYDMALPSFVQHLKILEQAGLVRSRKAGRTRTYELVPRAYAAVDTWLSRQRSLWERRLDQLDNYLTTIEDNDT